MQTPRAGVAVGGDDPAELGMHRRAVKALGEILDEKLPVRAHVGDDALADPQSVESVTREALRELFERLAEWRRVAAGKIDEHEAAPRVRRDLEQREFVPVEVGCRHSS